MFNEYYTEFNIGDLIILRDGITSYPYFESLEDFRKDPRLNMNRFGSEQLIVLNKVYESDNKIVGYECLCAKEKIFIMDMSSKDFKLEVGFCYVNI